MVVEYLSRADAGLSGLFHCLSSGGASLEG
jgi:hypothetical protein